MENLKKFAGVTAVRAATTLAANKGHYRDAVEMTKNINLKIAICGGPIYCLVKILMEKEIPLLKQPEDYQGPFKVSYYYPESPSIASDFATIQELMRRQ